MNAKPESQKILVLSGARGDTRRYRAFHLYQQLRLIGLDCVLSDITDPAVLGHAANSNLVFIHRAAHDRFVQAIVGRVHHNGGMVIFDTDDLIFDPSAFAWIDSPDFRDPVRAKLYREHLDHMRRTLELADAVLVSTGYLAEQVRLLGKPVWIHRNGYSLELGSLSAAAAEGRRPQPPRVVIGYASGTPTHNRDFALVQPALSAVLRKFPQAELWLIGQVTPVQPWGELAGQVRSLPPVPWRALPGLLARLDINLAPLAADNPFSQSKSEIKYMEAGLVGVPTIASPTDAFRYAIRPGENGLLAEGEEDWIAGLTTLIVEPGARQRIGETARRVCLADYSPLARAAQLRRTILEMSRSLGNPTWAELPDLPGSLPADPRVYMVPPENEKHPNLLDLGYYYVRLGDYRRMAGMAWVQMRRWLAPVIPF